ncbi:MAG TPA: hypothetical protein DCS60_01370 [Opitutae bacterium]|nr:hypothetical protein [Opitutae bacterium]
MRADEELAIALQAEAVPALPPIGIPPDVIASRKRKFDAAKLSATIDQQSRLFFDQHYGRAVDILAVEPADVVAVVDIPAVEPPQVVAAVVPNFASISWENIAAQEDIRRIQSEGPGPVYKVGQVVPFSDNLHVVDQNFWNDPSKCGSANNATKERKERDARFPQCWMRPASRPWDPRRPCVDCTVQECQEILEKKYKMAPGSLGLLCRNPGNNKLLRFLVSWHKHVTSTQQYQLDDNRKVLNKQVVCTSLQTFLGTDKQGIMRAVLEHEAYITSPDALIELNRERTIRALGSLPLFAITLHMGWERTDALKRFLVEKPLRGGWAMIPLEGEISASQIRALLSRAHLP